MADPFTALKIASHEPLRDATRSVCPKCQASRKYYCYECYVMVGIERSLIPSVTLPIKVDIIKHQRELVGKSTATHAAVLAPQQVNIFDFPKVPEFESRDVVVVVYPAETALTLKQMGQQSHGMAANHKPFNHVVFIDSTWQQANKIITDERIAGLQRVKIEDAKTYFWRPQQKPDTCLATIEAVYYFFKEYDKYILEREYEGQYDNLLYFFVFQYNLIQQQHRKSKKSRTL